MSLSEMKHSEKSGVNSYPEVYLPIATNACKLPLPTRVAFVGNYQPRECGIATFTTDLCTSLASYVGWVWSAPREIGRGEWKVNLPSGPSTLLQIGIGILDLGCCALAMYILLPNA